MPGLSDDPGFLVTGGNSGYQAIGLAVHFGASRIILTGYDMQATGGKSHWHGDHGPGLNNPKPATLSGWVENFATLPPDLQRRGVEVINSTRITALTCFPRKPLEAVL